MNEENPAVSASPAPFAEASAPSAGARYLQILRFLFKYRHSGVFAGLDVKAAELGDEAPPAEEGRPEEFVKDLEALGPSFVKLGQSLSTRPDMVPPAYLDALQRMQDDVSPLDAAELVPIVEEELGVRLSKIFVEFDTAPLGGASLAQVHRARLRDGRQVAVKIQRPNIVDTIRLDLSILAALAEKVDRFTDIGRRMRFSEWIGEFRKSLFSELDYRAEADNLQRFGQHLAAYPELYVPQPLWDLTGRRVLTMELVSGVKTTDLSGLRRTEESFAPLARTLMKAYLDQVFVHGDIHADPHPGNLLVTGDGRLALLDLGMISHIPPNLRERLLKLLFAAVDGRGEAVAAESIAIGMRLEDFEEARYLREVGALVSHYAARIGSAAVSEGRLMLDLTRIGASCGLRTPPELSLLGKTLLNLEAVCKALDPEIDMKRIVEEHLESVMRKRLKKAFSPASLATDAIELQALLREAPQKLSSLLSLLADNRLQIRMTGLEESRLIENLQKIANRISVGLIIAALILSSALLMRIESSARIFGYPALALLLFLLAGGLGFGLVVHSMLFDRRARQREERGPR